MKTIKITRNQLPKHYSKKRFPIDKIIMVLAVGATTLVTLALLIAIIYFVCILLITPHSSLL